MIRLIVQYHSGDGFECSCTETLGFEYESKEALIEKLDETGKEYVRLTNEKRREWLPVYEAHNAALDTNPKRTEREEIWATFNAAVEASHEKYLPRLNELALLKSGEYEMHIEFFVTQDNNGQWQYYRPEVYTVDEWFWWQERRNKQ